METALSRSIFRDDGNDLIINAALLWHQEGVWPIALLATSPGAEHQHCVPLHPSKSRCILTSACSCCCCCFLRFCCLKPFVRLSNQKTNLSNLLCNPPPPRPLPSPPVYYVVVVCLSRTFLSLFLSFFFFFIQLNEPRILIEKLIKITSVCVCVQVCLLIGLRIVLWLRSIQKKKIYIFQRVW